MENSTICGLEIQRRSKKWLHNQAQAFRINILLGSYRRACGGSQKPDEADLRDLLTDIQHYCRREKIDFTKELRIAQRTFEDESTEV